MKPKILIVEDDKDLRQIIIEVFKPFDCELFEAANGFEGLAVAIREKPDLITLDLAMPVMDGLEMLAKLKASPELKNIAVIVLTGVAGRETVMHIARLGVRAYLLKPFKPDQIIERASRVIILKPKVVTVARIRRFDDPLTILVVDDKPAILEQVRQGLADTPWTVQGRSRAGETIDFCSQTPPDVILVSLSLPDKAAFTLFQLLRANSKAKTVPVFGLCVRTAAEEQLRAQQAGFTGIITKPIDFEELKGKISRALNLDTSFKYFEQRDGVLVIKFPANATPNSANEISLHLRNKVSEAADAGLDKLVLDMSQLASADVNIIRLGLSAMQLCQELSLKQRVVGSKAICKECKNYEETKDWLFVSTFEEALAAFNGPPVSVAVGA